MKVRELTLEEVEQLEEKYKVDLLSGENINSIKVVKIVLQMVLSKEDLKKLKKQPLRKSMEVFSEVIKKTFEASEEEKENL